MENSEVSARASARPPAELEIRALTDADPPIFAAAFSAIGWNKPASLYRGYLEEQVAGARSVLVATVGGEFVGYVTVRWGGRVDGVPEIEDFNVLPPWRRRRIGTALLDEAERAVAARSPQVAIGVGADRDYGPAQRMYALRGYAPDARGLLWRGEQLRYGDVVTVDDDLILYMYKRLA